MRHNKLNLQKWAGAIKGVPAFIIGNGPSLNWEDCQLLEGLFTIGINRAFYYIDPIVLFWQDIGLWNTEHYRIINTQALKVARDIADPRKLYYQYHLKSEPYKFDKRTNIRHGRGSSGPLACQLAVAMGCTSLVLLGMDGLEDVFSSKSNFYGSNPHHTALTKNNCQIGLEFLQESSPVPIYNCSKNNLWVERNLGEVIAELNPEKVPREEWVRRITRSNKPF